ncbi:MAG: bifunctional DedA family/phosphatase PAP2 family protein [Pseudomonadota bacterium]
MLVIGIIALLESLALVGLLVPGVVLITAASSLAGHQEIAVSWMLAAAFIGAISGDLISFRLGYWENGRVLKRWPLSQHPDWVVRGQVFFARYGAYSVFIGRFIGPVRPIIPLVAGMMRMSPVTFLYANIASALLWAPAYTLPGYWLGHTWQQRLAMPAGLEMALFTLAASIVLLAVFFSWGRLQAGRQGVVYRWSLLAVKRLPLLRRPWLAMSQHGDVPIATLLLLVLSVGGLSAWTLWVMIQQGPTPLDVSAQRLFDWLRNDTLMALSSILARVGDLYGLCALLAPWGIWMLVKHCWALLGHWLAAILGIALLNSLGKALIGRERPFATEQLADSMAYPSAHTSSAVVIIGLAAAFGAARLERSQRVWMYWAAIVIVLPTTLSHLVLGVHWLTDLVGGALLGLIVCALVRLSWQQRPHLEAGLPWQWLILASGVLLIARMAWLPAA